MKASSQLLLENFSPLWHSLLTVWRWATPLEAKIQSDDWTFVCRYDLMHFVIVGLFRNNGQMSTRFPFQFSVIKRKTDFTAIHFSFLVEMLWYDPVEILTISEYECHQLRLSAFLVKGYLQLIDDYSWHCI